MHQLRDQVSMFAVHARMLRQSSASFDALVLLQEADALLRGLTASRLDFQNIEARVPSLSRTLSSRPPATGGMPPAAQWGNEFRAGSKQFIAALRDAEAELGKLYGVANDGMNSPTRVATGPENLFDVLLTFMDALSRWIEYRRRLRN
jgi:hypothetical protein